MTDVINPTVARLTAKSLLGRKRTLLLMLLPLAPRPHYGGTKQKFPPTF